MVLPSFSDSYIVDNALWATILTVVDAALVTLVFLVSFRALKLFARTTRIERVSVAVERLRRPFRILLSAFLLLTLLVGAGVFGLYSLRRASVRLDLQKVIDALTLESVAYGVVGVVVVILLVLFWLWLRKRLGPLLARLEARLGRVEVLAGQGERVQRTVQSLAPLAGVLFFFAAVKIGVAALGQTSVLIRLTVSAAFVSLVIAATRSVLLGSHLLTWSLERLGQNRLADTRYGRYYDSLRNLWPLAQRSLEAVAWIAAVTLVVGELAILDEAAAVGPILIRIVGIFFLARVGAELMRVLVDEWFAKMESGSHAEVDKRRRTLGVLINNILRWVIFFVAALLMLQELGLDPAPFLAGAGILGVAIGLGAKEIIGDLLQGFIMMFEGRLNPGDYVRIGSAQGIIENISMRVTEIRDAGGRLHTLRNGQITEVVNFSREWVNALVDVLVPHGVELAKVQPALIGAGASLKAELPELVTGETTVVGVVEIFEAGVVIRTTTRVRPGQHGPVERRYRALVMEALSSVDVGLLGRVLVRSETDDDASGFGSKRDDDDD